MTEILCTICLDYQCQASCWEKVKNLPVFCKWYNWIPFAKGSTTESRSCFRNTCQINTNGYDSSNWWSIGTNGTNRKWCHSSGSVGEYASHLGDFDYFPMWPGLVQGNSNGPLVPMVPLVPMENDAIPMVLLVQNRFAFTPSRNALIIIWNIPRSISQPRNDKFAFTPSKSAL